MNLQRKPTFQSLKKNTHTKGQYILLEGTLLVDTNIWFVTTVGCQRLSLFWYVVSTSYLMNSFISYQILYHWTLQFILRPLWVIRYIIIINSLKNRTWYTCHPISQIQKIIHTGLMIVNPIHKDNNQISNLDLVEKHYR